MFGNVDCQALEHHSSGARWHAVAEEGVVMREIVQAMAQAKNLPAVSVQGDEAAQKTLEFVGNALSRPLVFIFLTAPSKGHPNVAYQKGR